MKLENYKGYEQKQNQIILHFEKYDMFLEVLREDIVNVFIPRQTKEHNSKAIENREVLSENAKGFEQKISVKESTDVIEIATSKVLVKAGKNGLVDFYRPDQTPLAINFTGERKKPDKTGENFELLMAEGHDATDKTAKKYPIHLFYQLEKEDCFYGLGDKSGFINKREYEYENWNTDNPQAHNEDFKALYKSVPFMMGVRRNAVFGLFFDNSFRSFFNLGKECPKYYYYGATDGNLDLYFFAGETLPEIIEAYTYLTGTTLLPQRWALGYQQSRWGYNCKEDIMDIAENYRKHQIPCDVIHLDIDYMDGYRVFTWDEENYGKRGELFDKMKEMGFKPVCIIDPGTKLDEGYFMYDEGLAKKYFATDKDGNTYVNVVWPGESVYPDFGRKEVRKWWGEHHKELLDMGVRGIWNDMNEPASFRGELPSDVVFHHEERTTNHAEMHNVYGHFMSRGTFEGIKELTGKRPFVITRACYAGTQKYSTVWTGDNQSLWEHIQMVIPQLCNLGISGFSFCGTDIGGFGADVTPELLCRWVEAAMFSPLFRNHAAMGTRRQEPWYFEKEVVDINRKYIELRYQFLPYIYDLFYKGEKTGLPVMRPLVLHYTNDPETYNLNGEFLVGENLLVAPVLEQGATKKMVYLPEGTWYDYWTKEKIEGKQWILRDAPLDVCPMYVKEGSIIPMYEVMQYVGEKPYTTLKLLTTPGVSSYEHFQDNGEDYKYKEGEYNLYRFTQDENGNLATEIMHEGYKKYEDIQIVSLR